MGLVGASDDNTGKGEDYADDVVFHQSVDVRFRMTGEADNGLSFGAQLDLDDLVDTGDDPVDVAGDFADFTVFISGEFGTLTMGDTDGAFDWALQEVNIGSPGSIADNETEHAGYNGNAGLDGFEDFDGQVLRYDYSFGDFGFALSAETGDSDDTDDSIFGIGFRYAFAFSGGEVGFGLGYQTVDDAGVDTVAGRFQGGDQGRDIIGVSLSVELDNGLSAAINYSDIDGTGNGQTDVNDDGVFVDADDIDGEHIAIGASYTFDAITLHANYGEFDWDANSGVADSEGFGLAASYDFGGGLSAHIGYGYSDIDGQDDFYDYSFGLAMSF